MTYASAPAGAATPARAGPVTPSTREHRQRAARCRGAHDGLDAGVGQHEPPPLRRVRRIDRHVRRAGLEHTERGDHEVGGAGHRHRDPGLQPDAVLAQPGREPGRALVELGIGHPDAARADRDRLRGQADLTLDRLVDRGCRRPRHGAQPLLQHVVVNGQASSSGPVPAGVGSRPARRPAGPGCGAATVTARPRSARQRRIRRSDRNNAGTTGTWPDGGIAGGVAAELDSVRSLRGRGPDCTGAAIPRSR